MKKISSQHIKRIEHLLAENSNEISVNLNAAESMYNLLLVLGRFSYCGGSDYIIATPMDKLSYIDLNEQINAMDSETNSWTIWKDAKDFAERVLRHKDDKSFNFRTSTFHDTAGIEAESNTRQEAFERVLCVRSDGALINKIIESVYDWVNLNKKYNKMSCDKLWLEYNGDKTKNDIEMLRKKAIFEINSYNRLTGWEPINSEINDFLSLHEKDKGREIS